MDGEKKASVCRGIAKISTRLAKNLNYILHVKLHQNGIHNQSLVPRISCTIDRIFALSTVIRSFFGDAVASAVEARNNEWLPYSVTEKG
jgi:hypothetical protein